ncbi:DUF3040 domain-containing protein [Micromonosporaceae bacterium Da 78-11]
MLDPDEELVFDGMMTQLRTEDPRFLRRLGRLGRPRRRLRTALTILLWTMAPICIVYGGWTGVLMAVVAVGYGAHLMAKRDGKLADFSWWTSSSKRPGATPSF